MTKYRNLNIFKRDADCYDITDSRKRVGGLRSEFTEDSPGGSRTAIPGTWRITHLEDRNAERFEGLRFGSAAEAYGVFCGQFLE